MTKEELLSKIDDIINDNKCRLLILDHLEDPHNLGAIIRTAEAAGINGIILPKNRSVSVNETVMKTSVGALYNVSICQVTNLNQTIKKLKDIGFWIIGTDMDGTDYNEIDYKGKIINKLDEEEDVLYAELDTEEMHQYRKQLPILKDTKRSYQILEK